MESIESNEEAAGGSLLLEDKTASSDEESVELPNKQAMENSELHLRFSEIIMKKSRKSLVINNRLI
jgi:hypothetical protein